MHGRAGMSLAGRRPLIRDDPTPFPQRPPTRRGPTLGRITHSLDLCRCHRRGLITESRTYVSQDIGELLVVQAHGGHGDEAVILAEDLGVTSQTMDGKFNERLRIASYPLALGERRIHSGQTLSRGLVAIQAEGLIDGLAGRDDGRATAGDLLEVSALRSGQLRRKLASDG